MALRWFHIALPKLSILSLLMLFAVISVWLHTNQGKKIDWNGIDPRDSLPTYAMYLQWDDWSFWRYDPLAHAVPVTEAHYAGKRRRLFLGLFWQWKWPRVVVMTGSPKMIYCTGFETELRLPYWFLFMTTSILPACHLFGRLRMARIARRENSPIISPA